MLSPSRRAFPSYFVIAALLSALLVAAGDVLLAARSAAQSGAPVPAASLFEALLAAAGLYAGPALLLGLVEAWIAESFFQLFGPEAVGRARRALSEPGLDAGLAAGAVACAMVLVLDAALLYGYVRGIGFEMANRRNGALTSAMVAVAGLPLLSLLGLPFYRIARRLVAPMPRPRLLFTGFVFVALLLLVAALALLSVDWRIIHFGPAKALGCFVALDGLLVWGLLRSAGPRHAWRDAVLLLLLVSVGVLGTVHTLRRFGGDPRALALLAEETAGASFLLKRARGLLDRDGDGYAARLGGGDCDDRDPSVYPGAEEIAGNGRDEDCDGQDAAAEPPAEPPAERAAPAPAPAPKKAAAEPAKSAAKWDGNWLLITVDTLRADRIKPELAPNLAALAERGARFTNVYAQAPNTPRSFPSFVTSRLPSEVHFVRQSLNFSPVTGRDPTLFTALFDAGYFNIGVFSHFYLDRKTGLSTGFAEWHNDGAKTLHDSNSDIAAPRITQAVIDRIKKLGGRTKEAGAPRFALWTHLFDPHSTYMDHAEYPVQKGWKFTSQRYDAEVAFTDKHIGLILGALRDAGLSERTAVAVFSDHGEAFGEHKLGGEPLYFHGEALYNEVLRVPLIIYVPGQPPRVIDERVTLLDVAPTVLDLSGAAVPQSFHGRSLAPLLLGSAADAGEKKGAPPAIAEMLPCTAWPKNERVIVDTIDGTDYALYVKFTDNLSELYNLASDPTQQRNLIHAEPSKAHELQRRLSAYLRPRH